MGENRFYVDAMRDFRDHRYEDKHQAKVWSTNLAEAMKEKNSIKIKGTKYMLNRNGNSCYGYSY